MSFRYKKGYRRQRKTGLLLLVIALALVILGISGYKLYQGTREYSEGDDVYEDILEIATEDQGIDFQALQAINPNIRAWIAREDIGLNYPVVQGDDNEYYLKHLVDGTVNKMGSIYMDYRNSPDFSDENTILYGHNMKNGAMFAMLTQYKDPQFYVEHPTLELTTPDAEYIIDLFSFYTIDTNDFVAVTDFGSDVEFISYTQEIIGKSAFKCNINVKPTDKLITLYTCTYDYDNARFILTGVLREKR